MKSASPRWLSTAVIWLGFGLFDATQTVFVMRSEGMHHYWIRLFFTRLFSWLPWMLATPLVMHLGRRYPLAEWKRITNWAAHLFACVGIGFVSEGWLSAWEEWLNPWALASAPHSFLRLWWDKFENGLLTYIVLYGLILLVGHMIDSREQLAFQQTEQARLSEQLMKAQLSALRRQIEPHFLFNTLNAIAGLVREERNDAAVSMIAGLSDFLRRVVETSDRQQVPLAEELEFTRKYLEIQQVRFAERLQFSVDVGVDLLPAQVPSLILQPMVENAVKHGIAKRVQGGAIRIAASRSNGRLTLSVYNDGPGVGANCVGANGVKANGVGANGGHPGIGIANVRTRLQSLYGNAFDLTLQNCEPEGVEATVSVPYVVADSRTE